MDPNANLREQREHTAAILRIWDTAGGALSTQEQIAELESHAYRLAELVQALDDWIKGGGFLPDSWAIGQKRA